MNAVDALLVTVAGVGIVVGCCAFLVLFELSRRGATWRMFTHGRTVPGPSPLQRQHAMAGLSVFLIVFGVASPAALLVAYLIEGL